MKKILIVDDDRAVRRSLEISLSDAGYQVFSAADGPEGLEVARREDPDLVLLDLRLPGMDGFDVLRNLKREDPGRQLIVITAFDDMQTAIEAMKLGAADHLGKPIDMKLLRAAIAKVFQAQALSETGYAFGDHRLSSAPGHMIVGRSQAMKEVFKAIGVLVNSRATVLVQGESGTGKELVAKAVHFNSPEADRPFVPVLCSALAPTLLESELFGHEKGAFTGADQEKAGKFERADGGTLFLDEISEVSLPVQVKLLRFLQEREFERVGGTKILKANVRVVAATNRDLTAMVSRGEFRQDLYYRLKVVTIRLPSLRERREDIPLLVRFFLDRMASEIGRRIEVVPESVMERLLEYDWPGNVRELENVLRRAAILSQGDVLLPDTLELEGHMGRQRLPLVVKSLEELEKEHIENILLHTGYHKARTAQILNISRPTLNKRIREHGIRVPGPDDEPD